MSNMWWKYITHVILFRALLVSAKYECITSGSNITCSSLEENSLYDNLTVTLTKEESDDLHELQIVNSSISVIKSDMFDNFPNIEVLHLRNTSTQKIEEGAFANLFNLKKVYLTNNYLQELSSSVFPLNNSIQILDVSHNLLNNLSDFDVWSFPALTIMNVSYNKLEYLPENIISKLNEENKFYLIIDNNPWNCMHPDWVLHLTEILEQAFCTNTMYDPSEVQDKEEKLQSVVNKTDTKDQSDQESNSFCCIKYSLKTCLFWALGAVWIGIIIGNMCKLKRLLFTTPRRLEDKTTQCELWREPFMREQFSKTEAVIKAKKSATKLGTTKENPLFEGNESVLKN